MFVVMWLCNAGRIPTDRGKIIRPDRPYRMVLGLMV